MKTKGNEKALYIRTIAIGVRDKNGRNLTELTMICPGIHPETRARLDAIVSIQVRIADNEHEIAAYNNAAQYLGPLLHDSDFSDLGAVAKLLKLLKHSATIDLRLFSMGEPEASYVKCVEGGLIFYESKFLPDLRIPKAA